jgi:hypothetical protein
MTDKIDVNSAVSDEEARAWAESLSESDKAELKGQQLLHRAIAQATPKPAPGFASMSESQLEEFKRKNGFYK